MVFAAAAVLGTLVSDSLDHCVNEQVCEGFTSLRGKFIRGD
jgi:hypothetical protein